MVLLFLSKRNIFEMWWTIFVIVLLFVVLPAEYLELFLIHRAAVHLFSCIFLNLIFIVWAFLSCILHSTSYTVSDLLIFFKIIFNSVYLIETWDLIIRRILLVNTPPLLIFFFIIQHL